jgi:hypothetical protein
LEKTENFVAVFCANRECDFAQTQIWQKLQMKQIEIKMAF